MKALRSGLAIVTRLVMGDYKHEFWSIIRALSSLVCCGCWTACIYKGKWAEAAFFVAICCLYMIRDGIYYQDEVRRLEAENARLKGSLCLNGTELPWCEECGSWHHPSNPTCFRLSSSHTQSSMEGQPNDKAHTNLP